jgi:hypothetical protein
MQSSNNQPICFSDYFKIDKVKLKKLGTFDPILNYDTSLFVEPLLLVKSSSDIIANSKKTYDKFFLIILKLLRNSKQENDKAWQGAKRLVNFPEYKYTCIGYAGTSSFGSGSGAELNDKILKGAKEMIEISRDEPEILPFLSLLEEGIGGDRISDMTQKIIDKEICEYTIDTMKQIDFKGKTIKHQRENGEIYHLPYNPYSKCSLKLLPEDILMSLPVANNVANWTLHAIDENIILRNRVNTDLGNNWEKETKKYKKEKIIDKIKTDKEFFLEIIRALRDSNIEHYDLEKDSEGLWKWLLDSEKFIKLQSLEKTEKCEDNLEAIAFEIQVIINHFQDLIENKELYKMFWSQIGSRFVYVKEHYSKMLFYVICDSWLKSKDSNIKVYQDNSRDLKFTISNKFNVFLNIKHASNHHLETAYKDQLEFYQENQNSKGFFMVLNFKEEEKNKQLQFKNVKLIQKAVCKVIEIDCQRQELIQKQEVKERVNQDFINYNRELIKLDFEDVKIDPFEEIKLDVIDFDLKFQALDLDFKYIEFEEMPKIIDNSRYIAGAKEKNKDTDLIKINIIKPMFLFIQKEGIVKGRKYNVSKIANKIITQLNEYNEDKLIQMYQFKDKATLDKAIKYCKDKAGGEIDNWCYKINKKEL